MSLVCRKGNVQKCFLFSNIPNEPFNLASVLKAAGANHSPDIYMTGSRDDKHVVLKIFNTKASQKSCDVIQHERRVQQ